MRKLLFVVLCCVSFGVLSDEYEHHRHHEQHEHNNWWIAPAIVGGAAVIGGAYGYNNAYRAPVPAPEYPAYSPYHYEFILDAYCNCYRRVLVGN